MKHLLILLILLSNNVFAVDEFKDYRMCGFVNRKPNGEIIRRTDVLVAFQKLYPCPSTGKTTGACPKWERDHTIPLSCGGCDSVTNLAWIPVEAKTCTKAWCKDRYERKIYGTVVKSNTCTFTIIK